MVQKSSPVNLTTPVEVGKGRLSVIYHDLNERF